MNYTIAVLEDVHNNIQVNFDKDGNKYTVGIYHNETKEYTHQTFDTKAVASAIFLKLSKVIIYGDYSYEDRKNMLKVVTL